MAKSVHNDVLDAALNAVKNAGTRLCVCSAEPTTYTEAITTYKLAIATIDSSDFTGPADGDTSGRKLAVNAQSGLTVDTSGTATHIAVADSANSKLLYVTTCTSQALTSGNTVDVPAWDIEIADPA
jgi:hypothetical protein